MTTLIGPSRWTETSAWSLPLSSLARPYIIACLIGGGCCCQDRGWAGGPGRAELMAALRSCFPRTQTWQQAGKYVSALVSDLPKRNGWTTAEHAGDRGPDRMQRLLNRASWCAGRDERGPPLRLGRAGEGGAAGTATGRPGDRGD